MSGCVALRLPLAEGVVTWFVTGFRIPVRNGVLQDGILNGDSTLCPRFRAGLCDLTITQSTQQALDTVSMPSVSGWALRHEQGAVQHSGFIVSMPSVSGWALRPARLACYPSCMPFRCFGFGLGFATRGARMVYGSVPQVSMPSVSGWALHHRPAGRRFLCPRFRAGLCDIRDMRKSNACIGKFLCPRFRAGLCDRRGYGDKRSGVHVSIPSVSGWALRHEVLPR